jgi:hypothetical protein
LRRRPLTGSAKPPKISTIGTTGSRISHFARQVVTSARRQLKRGRFFVFGEAAMPQMQASRTISSPGTAPPRNISSMETWATIE